MNPYALIKKPKGYDKEVTRQWFKSFTTYNDGEEYEPDAREEEILTDEDENIDMEDLKSEVNDMTDGAQVSDEDRLQTIAKDAELFRLNGRRMVRFSRIMAKGKAAAARQSEQLEYDFSDTAPLPKKTSYSTVECKVGRYIVVEGKGRQKRWEELPQETIDQLDSELTEPCDCEICVVRRKNSMTLTPSAANDRESKREGWIMGHLHDEYMKK